MEISRRYLLRNGVAATGASLAYSPVAAAVPTGAFTPEQFGGKGAATRAALAGLATTSPAYLSEAGREGIFVFNSADLSARVTADTRQGVYVAPTGQNGSTGAWVRRIDGYHNVRWFGAVGDNVTNDGPVFVAAIAYMKSIKNAVINGVIGGSATLFVPQGYYFLNLSTLDFTHTLHLLGEGHGSRGGAVSVLRWSAGATGIRTQRHDTTGAGGFINHDTSQPIDPTSGAGSTIEGLQLIGAYTTAVGEGEFHGIHMRATATIRNCNIAKFQGDGIYANTAGGAAKDINGNVIPANYAIEGNTNLSVYEYVGVGSCRNGIYLNNADANVCMITKGYATDNRRWGFWDSSFLGNTYISCESADNGIVPGMVAPFTMVSHNGNRYYVKQAPAAPNDGDVAGGSTNAPSGTTADNEWWGFAYVGGPMATVPAWTSGVAYRSGGSYRTDSDAAENLITGCYSEGGQGPAQIVSPTLLVGGLHGSGVRGGGVYLRAVQSALYTDSSIVTAKSVIARGRESNFGPSTGPASDSLTKLNTTNAVNDFEFWSYLGGAARKDGNITTIRDNAMFINSFNKIVMRVADAAIYNVDAAGIVLTTGKTLTVGTDKVVGARGAALPVDATDLATAIALINAMKARLKATGGHGLVAD